MGDGAGSALPRLVNLQGFSPTIQAFNGGTLLIEPLVGSRLTVQPPAKQIARFDNHFTHGLTGQTDKALDTMGVFNPPGFRLHFLVVAATQRIVMRSQTRG